MAKTPSGALAGAASAAATLAGSIAALARTLPVPVEDASAALRAANLVAGVLAPRIARAEDVAEIGERLTEAVQLLGRAAEPQGALMAFYEAAKATVTAVPVSASPILTAQYAMARGLAACLASAWIGEAIRAELARPASTRADADAARARIAREIEAASTWISRAAGAEVAGTLSEVGRLAASHLVERVSDLPPLVRLDLPRSVPSSAVAFILYGDPKRAGELVERNAVATPMFMPVTLEAEAPKDSNAFRR